MDILQLVAVLICLALALYVLVQWIGWNNYWKTRHAIRDELAAIAEEAEKTNDEHATDGVQR